VFLVVVALVLIIVVTGDIYTKEFTVSVTAKNIVDNPITGKKNLVDAELENGDMRVFFVGDSPFRPRDNSKEVYEQIEVGKTYIFEVYGSYIPGIREYENILKIREVK
jgi:hypothetical protein